MSKADVSFIVSASEVPVYDFLEVTIRLNEATQDPFRSVEVSGTLNGIGIDGFCDAQDGSVFRIRFMPTTPGKQFYTVLVKKEGVTVLHQGVFLAIQANRKGLLQVAPDYPFHFIWSGTGEHFFWNGTTAYLLPGCRDEVIHQAIERFARLGVNRLRVGLCPSRQQNGGRWYEPQVIPREDFTFCYSPWLCAHPDSILHPRPDVTRFDIAYWQRFEGLLALARAKDIVVQVVFFVDGQEPQNYPFDRTKIGDDSDERRYYAYAVARLAAFSNVEWCLTNEWKLFRPDEWGEAIGNYIQSRDPYHHVASIHGHGVFPFRKSPWATHALFQCWDEHGGNQWMRRQRDEQMATGRPMPQINEEYGYEDHYPGPWGEGRVAPARSGDNRRKLAWEIVMAGCYQTTGESAGNGLGGWVNGLGDDSMTMLVGNNRIRKFFEAFEWWRLEPTDRDGIMALTETGVRTVLYFPDGVAPETMPHPEPFFFQRWYNPRTGTFEFEPDMAGDWVCLQEKYP